MRAKDRPDWWPKNPYPIEIFPMDRDEYSKAIPDPQLRTAVSGMLGREFWEIASESIWNAFDEEMDEMMAEMMDEIANYQAEIKALKQQKEA